ncbi:MAG: hypothetical protein R3F59_31120 [Myxococcota bacterium]
MSDEAKLSFLREHGVDVLAHSQRDLLAHLLGVRDLLRAWGARASVCDAGLFHSVYGTEVFPTRSVPEGLRPVVRALIGDEAEALAFLFGVMVRESLIDNLYEDRAPFVESRLDDDELSITAQQLRDLCDLYVANWLEQRDRFPARQRDGKRRELERMRGWLIVGGRAAVDEAYGFEGGAR